MAKERLDGLRVAILAADGFEQLELTPPMKALQRRGADVEVISLRPGNIRGVNGFLPGKKVHVDRTIWTVDPADYDALLIPGGFVNPDLLRQSEQVLDFVRAIDLAGKPIAVICHAPWVLISAGLVQGRRLTSWPGIKDDVVNAGGLWEDSGLVHDGNWISSRGPQDLVTFRQAVIDHFMTMAPVGVGASRERESEGGGFDVPVGGMIATGLAVAALGYALRQWRGSRSETTETLPQADLTPAPAYVPPTPTPVMTTATMGGTEAMMGTATTGTTTAGPGIYAEADATVETYRPVTTPVNRLGTNVEP